MKAMIFAAGRGERMRPLTDTCPKPLLKVRGRPLIVWQILSLVRAGITEIVINHAHLGQMIEDTLGDGSRYGAKLQYSPKDGAGNRRRHRPGAPPAGREPFIAVSGDIWCPHFDYAELLTVLEDEDPGAIRCRRTSATWPGCIWSRIRPSIRGRLRAEQLQPPTRVSPS
jgi:MurNAc alpha-1-phosphate uridylyltransferase